MLLSRSSGWKNAVAGIVLYCTGTSRTEPSTQDSSMGYVFVVPCTVSGAAYRYTRARAYRILTNILYTCTCVSVCVYTWIATRLLECMCTSITIPTRVCRTADHRYSYLVYLGICSRSTCVTYNVPTNIAPHVNSPRTHFTHLLRAARSIQHSII